MEKVVDIPGINFVEERHQDEDIEDHGEVDVTSSWLGTWIVRTLKQKLCQNFEAFRKGLTCYPSAVYVKHFLSIEENKEDHCELVECLCKKKR